MSNKTLSQILADLKGHLNKYSSLVQAHAPSLKFLTREDLIEVYGQVLNNMKDCIVESQKLIQDTPPAKTKIVERIVEKIVEMPVDKAEIKKEVIKELLDDNIEEEIAEILSDG